MNFKQATTAALIMLNTPALAATDCQGIEGAGAASDRALLWRYASKWHPIRELNAKLKGTEHRTFTFAYVIKDRELGSARRGVIVVKSGFLQLRSADSGDSSTVALYRGAMKDPCRKRPYEKMQGEASVKDYTDYHDKDLRTNSDGLFSRFHVTYDSRRGCQESNDGSADAYFSRRYRSNRSQFSFDPYVVANGQYSQLLALFGVTPAFASPPIAGRTVQIRKYQADANGLACVKFRTTVGPGAFLRVNDLESRTFLGNDGTEWRQGTGPKETFPND